MWLTDLAAGVAVKSYTKVTLANGCAGGGQCVREMATVAHMRAGAGS